MPATIEVAQQNVADAARSYAINVLLVNGIVPPNPNLN